MSALEPVGNLWHQMTAFWDKLRPAQKWSAVAVSLLVFGVLIAVIVRSGSTEYVPLYTNLQESDAAEIVSALRDAGVSYRLADEGRVVLVPRRQVYQTRLDLAGQGLPQRGVVGFEIFQQAAFGSTDFERNVKYVWALQGELTRTIREYEAVENARVHISLPEKSLFVRDQRPATASVLLQLRPGARLSPAQIRSITHLVAHSVESLDPANVTIVDTAGNLLSQPADAETTVGTAAMQQLEIQRAFEQDVERHLQSMLERLYGSGKAIVRVKADMNFDSEEEVLEIFEPATPEGLVRISKTQEETVDTPPGTSGWAGVTGNEPEGAFPTYTSPEESSGPQRYHRRSADVQYEINRTERRRVVAPGRVEGLSVSVWIDGNLTAAETEALRASIAAAVGADRRESGLVTVASMPFRSNLEGSEPQIKDEPLQEPERAPFNWLPWVAAGAAVGLLAALLITLALRSRRRSVETAIPETAAAQEEPVATVPPPNEQARKQRAVEQLARDRPAEFARLIRTWLTEQ
ncbi:MAG: flagellar M-ring protein FliF [Firmicutes bacterium]|nr:flagellar M-ring protein FliF [Bacillota bacterium]